jgi:PEP-CTERM motif
MDRHLRFGIATRLTFAASVLAFAFGPVVLATEAPVAPAQAGATPMLEPSTLLMVGLGLVGIAIFRSRHRDSSPSHE